MEYDIREILNHLVLSEKDYIPYGFDKAKIRTEDIVKSHPRKGKLILTTAITPTKAGEGKTTTAIGLADGLKKLGYQSMTALREPSLGPVFGVKGGGAGGGKAILEPTDDINLHFTGDFHAITSLNNLIAAVVDNEVYQNSPLDIDPDRIVFPRCLDMNDRALREIEVSRHEKREKEHDAHFVITAASEIMAIFCLAKNQEDFLDRVENILVAYNKEGKPVFVKDLNLRNAMVYLMHDALYPNLVQSHYHTPSLVHGGPFANIAHGANSIIATDLALRLSDYVVTEAGFGSDLGAEKYLDIVTKNLNTHPSLVVMVVTVRALKLHGGVKFEDLSADDKEAMLLGSENLFKHIDNIHKYHLPVLVSINRFKDDHDDEIEELSNLLDEKGIDYAINTSYLDGEVGAVALAEKAIEILNRKEDREFSSLIHEGMSIKDKIETISREIYSADGVEYSETAEKQIEEYTRLGYQDFHVCMSKVPNSLSDDPHLLNVPKGFKIHVRSLRLFTGAGFIVPLTGDVFTMPGLPKVPSCKNMKGTQH